MDRNYRKPNTERMTRGYEGLISFVCAFTLMFGRDMSIV